MPAKAVIAIVLALAPTALAACGSDDDKSASKPLPAPPSGDYTAVMTTKGLEGKGVAVHDVGNAGTWTMTVGDKNVSMKPPGHEAIVYPVVSVTKDTLTLGPNPLCSTATGRSQKSVYKAAAVGDGVRFTIVKAPCPEDGGAIAAAVWKKK